MSDFDLDEWANLGNVLLRRGSLTGKQLDRALAEQSRRRAVLLGDILVEMKICERADIDEALREQSIHRIPSQSKSATAAHSMLQAAFARVGEETERMIDRRKTITSTTPIVLKFSPEKG